MTAIRDRVWTGRSSSEPPVMRVPAVYAVAAATIAIDGLNWPIMARGVELIPALWLAAFRMAGAALVVGLAATGRGRLRLPRRKDRGIVLSLGLGRLAFVTAAVFIAIRFVPAGRSAVLVYTASLWTVPMAVVVLHERLSPLRLAGLTLGCAGVIFILAPWSVDLEDADALLGFGLLLASAIVAAATAVHVRAHRWRSTPMELMPWLLVVAAVPLTLLAIAVDGVPDVHWTGEAIGIVAYQVCLGSTFALWGALTLIRSVPAITANLTLMAVPVIGLAASVVLSGERATPALLAGLILVLGGVALGLLSDRRQLDPLPASP
jgi:drug/metabolite transporter (DMT)-like permease